MKSCLRSVVFVGCAVVAGCGSSGSKPDGGGGGSGGAAGGGGGGTNVDAAVGGSCSFTACGGNLVGTWRFASSCGSVSSASCAPAQNITLAQAGNEATYVFASDGTFSATASGNWSQTLRYPAGCITSLSDAGTTQACAALEEAFRSAVQNVDSGVPVGPITFTCVVDGNQACVCSEMYSFSSPLIQTGTYTTTGNQVTVTVTSSSFDAGAGNGGAPAPSEYCVSGNTLTLRSSSSTTSTSVVTLTR